MTDTFKIRDLQAFCYRIPLAAPVVTSFGRMLDRPAVFIRIEDGDGNAGWGEAWCNFPAVGAEHRARIVNDMLAPMLIGRAVTDPSAIFDDLSAMTSVVALQSGEPGPFAQSIAGVDIALWDLRARRARRPLWQMLGGGTGRMRVYASGINPTGAAQTAETMLRRGHRAFKLKVGFDIDKDRANLGELRKLLGEAFIAVDANQAWSIDEALMNAPQLAEFAPAWIEEPIRADRPWMEWRKLRDFVAIPLAGGENIAGHANFDAALAENVFSYVQPDVAKWGGISGCAGVARKIAASGRTYCPHFLGGGIGLLASAHLLAAVGGNGLLEIDSNDNPLRERFCGAVAAVNDGEIVLPDAPGLGIAPDLAAIEEFRTL